MKLDIKTAQLKIGAERINFYYFDNLYLEYLVSKYTSVWVKSWRDYLRYDRPFWISEPVLLTPNNESKLLTHFRKSVFAEIHSIVDYLSLEDVICMINDDIHISGNTFLYETDYKITNWFSNCKTGFVPTTFLTKI